VSKEERIFMFAGVGREGDDRAKTIRGSLARHLKAALLAVACAAALLSAASAQAAIVTVGTPLNLTFSPAACGLACTVTNTALPETGAAVNSPVDGAVIRWHILKGLSGKKYMLRVLTPAGGTTFTGAGTSAAATAAGAGLETFETALPIKAGQTIGLDIEAGGQIGIAAGGAYAVWSPPLADGATAPGSAGPGNRLAFNAEILPPPGLTAIAPNSGSIAGGTPVLIAGTDFASVKAVSFGGAPATSFAINSENAITAVAPPSAGPGTVDVRVTTVAGQTPAVAADQFTYTACVVPKIQGKSLKASRKALAAAGCALGKVKGKKSKAAKVKKQDPKAGTALAPGGKVNVKLNGRTKSAGKK
jgi:IPT/TIG domain/PASTA domain